VGFAENLLAQLLIQFFELVFEVFFLACQLGKLLLNLLKALALEFQLYCEAVRANALHAAFWACPAFAAAPSGAVATNAGPSSATWNGNSSRVICWSSNHASNPKYTCPAAASMVAACPRSTKSSPSAAANKGIKHKATCCMSRPRLFCAAFPRLSEMKRIGIVVDIAGRVKQREPLHQLLKG